MKMPLQFHVNVVVAKDSRKPLNMSTRLFHAAVRKRMDKRTIVATSQTNEPSGMFLQFFFPRCAFAFGCAQFHFRYQTAEILVAETRLHQKGQSEFTTEARRHGGIVGFSIPDFLCVGACPERSRRVSPW
jgi:hypothetical protein